MKNQFLTIAASVITMASFSAFAQQTKSLQPGDDLPVLNTKMQNATHGSTMEYAAAAGKNGLLVIFSCNTCPYVVKNEGIIKKTMDLAMENGIGIVVINSNEAKRDGEDSYEAMTAYSKKQGFVVPYLVDKDSKLADAFGANRTPEVYLFNNQKKLVYKGGMTDNPANPEAPQTMYIGSAIQATVRGTQPEPNVTKSVGCSIKRKA